MNHKYDRILVSHYTEIPGRSYNPEKKEWAFSNEHENKVVDYLKYNNYIITYHDRTSQALLLALKGKLYLKYDFEPETKSEFEKSFDKAVFDPEDKDWSLPLEDYTSIKDFFMLHNLKFTYINAQIQTLLAYIRHKFDKVAAEEEQATPQDKKEAPQEEIVKRPAEKVDPRPLKKAKNGK